MRNKVDEEWKMKINGDWIIEKYKLEIRMVEWRLHFKK